MKQASILATWSSVLLLASIYCIIFPELHSLLLRLAMSIWPRAAGPYLGFWTQKWMHDSNPRIAFTCPTPQPSSVPEVSQAKIKELVRLDSYPETLGKNHLSGSLRFTGKIQFLAARDLTFLILSWLPARIHFLLLETARTSFHLSPSSSSQEQHVKSLSCFEYLWCPLLPPAEESLVLLRTMWLD